MWARVMLALAIATAVAFVVGGLVLYIGLDAKDDVRNELRAQQITFPQRDAMTEHELAIDGIEEHAGKRMETGEQARIYSEYILLHMQESAEEAGMPGATYATLGGPQREARAELAAAKESGDQAAIDEAQAKVDELTALRNTMLTGSNLRGNLLGAYGWDNIATNVVLLGGIFLFLGVVFLALLVFEWRRGHLPPVQRD